MPYTEAEKILALAGTLLRIKLLCKETGIPAHKPISILGSFRIPGKPPRFECLGEAGDLP